MNDGGSAPARPIASEHVREVGGRRQVTRDGIAETIGRTPRTVKHLAATDPAFPDPIEPPRRGRTTWYYESDVLDYATLVTSRSEVARPGVNPELAHDDSGNPLDPNELLEPERAAALIQVSYSAFRRYVVESIPYWDCGQPGILPAPDRVEVRGKIVYRWWQRDTLIAHQEQHRPGKGGGRRRANAQRANTLG